MKSPSARRPAFGKRKSSFGEGEGPRVERATIGSSPKKSFGGKKPFGPKRDRDEGFKGGFGGGFKGKKPCTTCRATDAGREAFNEYVDSLKDYLSLGNQL